MQYKLITQKDSMYISNTVNQFFITCTNFEKFVKNISRLNEVLKFLFFYFYDNFNLCCEYMSPQTRLFLVNHFYFVSFDREFEDIY